MGMTKNIANYADVQAIFDAFLKQSKRMVYTLPTTKNAVYWRSRAHYFRQLWRKEHGFSDYDKIILTCSGNKVLIDTRVIEGTLATEDGESIPVVVDNTIYAESDKQSLTPDERALIDSIKETEGKLV